MRSDGFQNRQESRRTADQVMFDREDDFRDDFQVAFKQKVVNAERQTGKRVLNGSEEGVGCAFRNGAKRESNVVRGTVVIDWPRSWIAAASLKHRARLEKATRG